MIVGIAFADGRVAGAVRELAGDPARRKPSGRPIESKTWCGLLIYKGWEQAMFRTRELSLPSPLVAVMLGLPPDVILVWRWRAGRVRPGHCNHCGYNLTGNVSGVCPECGTALPGSAENASA